MSDHSPHDLLAALRYRSADPATTAETARNHAVARLHGMCAEAVSGQTEPVVIPLRAGGCR